MKYVLDGRRRQQLVRCREPESTARSVVAAGFTAQGLDALLRDDRDHDERGHTLERDTRLFRNGCLVRRADGRRLRYATGSFKSARRPLSAAARRSRGTYSSMEAVTMRS